MHAKAQPLQRMTEADCMHDMSTKVSMVVSTGRLACEISGMQRPQDVMHLSYLSSS